MTKIVTGIDVGSAYTRVVVCEEGNESGELIVRALSKVPSDGLKCGNVLNAEAVSDVLSVAIREAERTYGARIKKAHVSIGGTGLSTTSDTVVVAVSRADSITSELDVGRALEESEAKLRERANTRIIHTIPSEFKIDGRKITGKPHGYVGNKLELRTVFITCTAPFVDALVGAVEDTGVEVEGIYAGPIAESIATLSPMSRNAGCALVNIGAETVSILTHEDGLPTSLRVFPIGSAHITHDIALGLRIPLDEAEQIKISIPEDKKVARRVGDIVEARLSDVFELIDTHLKKIGRSGLLPAGIMFTGGGSHISGIEELARKQLGLPARVAKNIFLDSKNREGDARGRDGMKARERADKARDPEWSIAVGLAMLGISGGEPEESLGLRVAKRTRTSLTSFFKQFLP